MRHFPLSLHTVCRLCKTEDQFFQLTHPEKFAEIKIPFISVQSGCRHASFKSATNVLFQARKAWILKKIGIRADVQGGRKPLSDAHHTIGVKVFGVKTCFKIGKLVAVHVLFWQLLAQCLKILKKYIITKKSHFPI